MKSPYPLSKAFLMFLAVIFMADEVMLKEELWVGDYYLKLID